MSNPVWVTNSGSIGVFPAGLSINISLQANPVTPATTVTYTLLSGSLPQGLSLNSTGLISGTPALLGLDSTSIFVVRATDNLGNVKDRSFSIGISGEAIPQFTTPAGNIFTTEDSVWIEYPLLYTNPVSSNLVSLRIIQGQLPPGLEMNSTGLIRGYPQPPLTTLNLPLTTTSALATIENTNSIEVFSTAGFVVDRPVRFEGTVFGGINLNTTYYVKEIISSTRFTISDSPGPGSSTIALTNSVGFMTVTLPAIALGQPTTRQYSFTVELTSPLGNSIENFFITIENHNLENEKDTRIPTIYNTRPPTYNIENTPNFGYYILPVDGNGYTYPPITPAYIGQFLSDNYFSFKILGHDFDGIQLTYVYNDLPTGLEGDPITGWITGTPILPEDTIEEYEFSVYVEKTIESVVYQSPEFYFKLRISNGVNGEIEWLTDDDLGIIYNSQTSLKKVQALSDVSLTYQLISGDLPPNLTLLPNGEITGIVAYQPTSVLLQSGDETIFEFTVEASCPTTGFEMVKSEKTFTLTVLQEYDIPTDTLYLKCNPSIEDRNLIRSLLNDEEIIPNNYLYRPFDIYFGKAKDVQYAHAYGIYANKVQEYIEAIQKNHYWRQITLGEIKTAIARDDEGEIIYEVVYSEVIDNLINPYGISVSENFVWPRPIYVTYLPEYIRTVYPNSLPNMRERVGQELGQEFDFKIFPTWMTSQQLNGSTLGFTPAWVIAYTKPGYAEIVKDNIETLWVDDLGKPYTLNTINFKIDRFIVDKTLTYNYDNTSDPPEWESLPSATPVPDPLDSEDFYVLFPQKTILPNDPEQ